MGYEIRGLSRALDRERAAADFIAAAKIIAQARGEPGAAQRLAAKNGTTRVIGAIEKSALSTKAAVAVAGLSDQLAPYKILASGFFGSMGEFSAMATI